MPGEGVETWRGVERSQTQVHGPSPFECLVGDVWMKGVREGGLLDMV